MYYKRAIIRLSNFLLYMFIILYFTVYCIITHIMNNIVHLTINSFKKNY